MRVCADLGVELAMAGAAHCSPPPRGEGSEVGVGECGTSLPQPHAPLPHPSPTRWEGAAGRLILAFCTLALAIVNTVPGRAQGTLPPGEGRDLMATACSQCHALNVIRSMREGAEGWKRHVHNMVTRGAQLNAREADMVVAYLAANFGPAGTPASASKVTLPGGSGKDLVETRCTACHDLERIALIKRHKADWPALVANMVDRGAVATPEEVRAISSYLVSHFGE